METPRVPPTALMSRALVHQSSMVSVKIVKRFTLRAML
jgi:hypothetical protein